MSVLEIISAGEIPWRPDWPPEMPPDLFAGDGIAVSGRPGKISVSLEFPAAPDQSALIDQAEPADQAGSVEYTLAYDGAGRLTNFPFFVNGGFFQTQVGYDTEGGASDRRITGLVIAAPTRWQLEVLEYDDETGLPALLRLNAGSAGDADSGGNAAAGDDAAAASADSGGSWFFVVLEYRGISVSETWYDPAGTGLAVYRYSYALHDGKKRLSSFADLSAGNSRAEAYHYDSWGNLTGINAEGGEYSAVYRNHRPQYWRRPFPAPPTAENAGAQADTAAGDAAREIPWRFIIQWDESGLITRLLGYPEDESAGGELDARYRYTPDDNGSWKERRETRMIRRGDYLFPQAGVFIRRRIEYPD
jgi:hypothetical protein